MDIIAVDIGGTHARFALAEVAGGHVRTLGETVTLRTADHASFKHAWEAFAAGIGRPLPRAAGIAVACPVGGEILRFTNNPWVIQPANLAAELGIDTLTLVNDFGAVGHAVAHLGAEHLTHISGPENTWPEDAVISVVGPGTGLGVAHVVRRGGRNLVIESEGGHVDFAPLDAIEDAILSHLRHRYRRVSVERLVSGPGLANIHEAIAAMENRAILSRDDKTLWAAALDGSDSLAAAALDRFCLILGSVAGDLALAQGASAVVLAGGVGLRLADRLPHSGFTQRFTAKGRFEAMMAAIPVKLITHPQPGLFGAAAAFAEAS